MLNAKQGCKPHSGEIDVHLMEQRPTYRAGFALDITLENIMSVSVYGFISGITTESQDAHNILQLQALPATGAYLIKSLFSHVPQSKSHSYYGGHIHFSAAYKEFYCVDNEWLEEFETLPSNLYWNEAEIIVTWSRERYTWHSNYSSEAAKNEPNEIKERERFESAWDLKQIPWNS